MKFNMMGIDDMNCVHLSQGTLMLVVNVRVTCVLLCFKGLNK